jgi:hypothetical protein
MAVTVLLTGGAVVLAVARLEARRGGEPSTVFLACVALGILGVAGFIVSRRRTQPRVEAREHGAPLEGESAARAARGRGGPYRAAGPFRRAPALPPLSGRLTALALLLSLGFTALVVPFAMRLPRWVEAEVVLGTWWLTWAVALATMLYRGQRVVDDHRFDPHLWLPGSDAEDTSTSGPAARSGNPGEPKKSGGWGLSGLDGLGSLDEGCLYILGAALLIGVAVVTAWLLVELVVPALFTLAYMLLVRAMARVTNDRHGCQGEPLRAVAYGALWATAYVVPLGLVVLVVHAIWRSRGAP